jgi:GalNAc5-diNAcBac-PP-undecaprenol beta-1,3-glucosyltransferase
MDSAPLVTVVIPTYRRASLVGRAIDCARNQTHRNQEIIVVDDGSPDETGDVVRAIAAVDARVRYVRHESNKGLPAGRNTGIRAASGEYIAFLDDDDEWRRDKIERQLQAMGEFDAVLCVAMSNGRPLRLHPKTRVTLDDLRRGSFDPSSLMARTRVLQDVLFDETLREGEDWDAFIRIAQRYSIGWVAEPLLLYNDGAHVRMTSEAKQMTGTELERRMAVLTKHRQFFGERWYKYHMASALLAYVGSRRGRFGCLAYAVKRCGAAPVAAVLRDRLRRHLAWYAWDHFGPKAVRTV